MNVVNNFVVLLCFAVLSVSLHAGAPAEYPKSESDFLGLPPYCKAKLFYGDKSTQHKQWQNRLGFDTFLHVHHYCAALFSMQSAYTNFDDRNYLLQRALANIAYMEKSDIKSSPLMPEILLKKGKILQMQGRDPEAIQAFQSSIALNKKYSPAYMAIADYFISVGKYDEALAITEDGLKLVPKSKGLKRRLDKINKKIVVEE